MEHSKKFALVPLDRMHHFEEDHLSELDTHMQTVLKQKKMSDYEKAVLYAQALQKYVTFPNVNSLQTPEETIEPPPAPDIETEVALSVPVKQRPTAKKILEFLNRHKNRLSWTASRELKFKGNVIYGSNIAQLIKFLVSNHEMKPVGYEQMKLVLDEIHFPQELVKNKYLRDVKSPVNMYAKPIKLERKIVKKKNDATWLKLK